MANKTKNIKTLFAKNDYDKFDLKFLDKRKDGKVFNGGYEVTNAPDKLKGVVTGKEEIKLNGEGEK